jgi:hypothetical protein
LSSFNFPEFVLFQLRENMDKMLVSSCKPDKKETLPPTVSFGAYSRLGLQPYAVGGFFDLRGCNHA